MSKKIVFISAICLVIVAQRGFAGTLHNYVAPPVFWNVVDAKVVKTKVELTWEVTEYNNQVFYIQHSTNGRDWTTVDSVNTKNSPLTLEEYHYTHVNKLEGRQYYRIRQVDIDKYNDGYSKVVSVVMKQDKKEVERPTISFSPNPAVDQVRIINNDKSSEVAYNNAKIYDLSGKLVAEKKLDSHSNIIAVGDLPTGIYVARIECSNGTVFTQKMIKQ